MYKIHKILFTKPQIGRKINYGTHVGRAFLEVRNSTNRCEVFPHELVVHTLVVFFKISEEHQTDMRCFLTSFCLLKYASKQSVNSPESFSHWQF
jgi:hypothetical protein